MLNSSIQQIVLTSTEQSKANEETYRQLHLPPYEERLKQTKEYTAKLEATKIVPLICEVYVKAPYSARAQLRPGRQGRSGTSRSVTSP